MRRPRNTWLSLLTAIPLQCEARKASAQLLIAATAPISAPNPFVYVSPKYSHAKQCRSLSRSAGRPQGAQGDGLRSISAVIAPSHSSRRTRSPR